MGDMTGYFTAVETGTSPVTFTFEGSLRSGTVGSSNNMVNTNSGHNFVGNPFTSAIDWEASAGWTKTDLYDAIYVYNGTSWASYVGGAGSNGGTQYIAMGQGFFVEVSAATGTSGTLEMTTDVCVHNGVSYLKNSATEQRIVRLEITDNVYKDETVIRFTDNATEDFDGNYDAHKFFSYIEGYPQIYSTANDFMSINSLPFNPNVSVPLDVRGQDGKTLEISATEKDGFAFLNLKDNLTGTVTDLLSGSYTFTFDSNVSDRFELFFGFTGVDENDAESYAKIFAVNQDIQVVLNNVDHANITVYNLLGQTITGKVSKGSVTTIPMDKSGYYIVKVDDGSHVTTQKVFIY
jgi:hypothetical protein